MEAVTTGKRAWRMAARAPQRSTRCMTLPPSRFPSTLASLGRANSLYSEMDSRTGFGVISSSCATEIAAHIGMSEPSERLELRSSERARGGGILQGAARKRTMIALHRVEDANRVAIAACHAEPHGVGPVILRKMRAASARVTEIAPVGDGLLVRLPDLRD